MVTVIGITSLTNTPLFWALCVLLTQKQAQFLFGNNYHFMAQITNEILHKCSAAQFIGKIDLFTDTAAISNLKGVLSDGQGALSQYLRTLFWQREIELHCIFLGKKAIIITSKHTTMIIPFPLQSFSRKTQRKIWPKKNAWILSVYRIVL